ncbi:MAG: T9SS type A sorting domain-containing protein, partial [Flavobacteriales bacterium]
LTAWSQGVLQDIQIDGNDTKKYSGLNFIGVETLGGNLIDASEMDFFHIDVWSANFTQLRIKLVDFGADEAYEGGDDTEHEIVFEMPAQEEWISYQIPMSEFENLTSSENLAQLVISAGVPGQAVVYIDNVYFSKTASNIDANLEAKINLYPNPATDVLTIAGADLSSTFTLIDSFGRIISEGTITADQTRINTSDLTSGVYRITFNINGTHAVKQFMKK